LPPWLQAASSAVPKAAHSRAGMAGAGRKAGAGRRVVISSPRAERVSRTDLSPGALHRHS
jgi:hypothetical protein